MIRKKLNSLECLEFSSLAPFKLRHGVFTRHGGISAPPFNSLNVGDNVEDDPECVFHNLSLIEVELGASKVLFAEQVHRANVQFVDENTPCPVPDCDAMITKTPNLALLIKHADCQAAILYDPVHHALALVHAGWKGLVLNIYAQTIAKMHKKIGTQPKDLIVCISPSLGPDHAEFINYKKEFPANFHSFQVAPNYFNLWEIARKQLEECNVKQIDIAEICTYCNPKDFFSYRRDKRTGRNGTTAVLL
jgi:purine-nucleoside/S-methyl-5'-thioadenosine phosphorylase / adenosine deaminase